jgi:hypothetical protein
MLPEWEKYLQREICLPSCHPALRHPCCQSTHVKLWEANQFETSLFVFRQAIHSLKKAQEIVFVKNFKSILTNLALDIKLKMRNEAWL